MNEIVVRAKRGVIVSADDAEFWLRDVGLGDELFHSLISFSQAAKLSESKESVKRNALAASGITLIGMLFTTMLTTPTGAFDTSLGSLTVLGSVVIPTIVVGGVAGLVTRSSAKRNRLWWNAIRKIQASGLALWLSRRYDINASEGALAAAAAATLKDNLNMAKFTDAEGRSRQLGPVYSSLTHQTSWQIAERETKQEQIIRPQLEVTSAEASELPGEAGRLHEQVVAQIRTLNTFALSVENTHIVQRAEKETAEAVSSYRQLEQLGRSDAGYAELLEVLSAVEADLKQIVEQEVAVVKKRLAVQGRFLRDNQNDHSSL